ncbi:MAG: 50S ribosomal protein L32e, partial [Candidatus Methanomethylophilus sp.]|nr:50S ribosomal protein L32e [Methanomethylophilus sp.]
NTAELESIGITTVDQLKDAVNDAAKAKEIIKTLSGVGPKTVENWKKNFATGETAKAKKEPVKTGAAPKTAKAELQKENAVSATAEQAKTEVVEAGAYTVQAKPELDEKTVDALAKRAVISGSRPAFKRQEWFRYPTLGDKWRRPKGIHSKMKRGLKRRPPMVEIGYGGPAEVRGLHPSGFEEVLVYKPEDLEKLDPKKQAARIGGTVGTKKRLAIESRAKELGIRVLNRMVA